MTESSGIAKHFHTQLQKAGSGLLHRHPEHPEHRTATFQEI